MAHDLSSRTVPARPQAAHRSSARAYRTHSKAASATWGSRCAKALAAARSCRQPAKNWSVLRTQPPLCTSAPPAAPCLCPRLAPAQAAPPVMACVLAVTCRAHGRGHLLQRHAEARGGARRRGWGPGGRWRRSVCRSVDARCGRRGC